jgi:hypothetical protein
LFELNLVLPHLAFRHKHLLKRHHGLPDSGYLLDEFRHPSDGAAWSATLCRWTFIGPSWSRHTHNVLTLLSYGAGKQTGTFPALAEEEY